MSMGVKGVRKEKLTHDLTWETVCHTQLIGPSVFASISSHQELRNKQSRFLIFQFPYGRWILQLVGQERRFVM